MNPSGFETSPPFPLAARSALQDTQLRANLRQATTTIRQKRDRLVAELPDFEELRTAAAGIKDDALSRLDELLGQLGASVSARGGHVHFAASAAEANEVVVGIVKAAGAHEVVKVKSMTTAECHLNDALAAAGIDVGETDLAELIVQLGADLPSHIVVPAIHRNRAEVRDIFLAKMGEHGRAAPADLSDDPADLAGAARAHLRERFLRAEVAISGANFAVAETGSLVVVESEGNGRMCLTLPRVLISVVGIDKVIPRFRDLGVFLQLLARSATGERMNPYTSIWSGVSPGDGPEEVHLVLLDNGRSSALADPTGRQALRCIRCAACLNVCPVYERVGGHAYGSVYPGPIGAVLTPQLHGVASDSVSASLPFASTLCGACYEVCPVKIDIPRLLVHLRARSVERAKDKGPGLESVAMATASAVLSSEKRFAATERLVSWLSRPFGAKGTIGPLPWPFRSWTISRDAPVVPRQSFRGWWRSERGPSVTRGPKVKPVRRARPARESATPSPAATGTAPAATGTEGVLSAVRAALRLAAFSPTERPHSYRDNPELDMATPPVDLLLERLSEYKATATMVGTQEVQAAIGTVLSRGKSTRVVVPAGFPEAWRPQASGVVVEIDGGDFSPAGLDGFDACLTGCAIAIAETGTIVLDGGESQGRRAVSLLPDHLVVVVRQDQVVATVPDAVARLTSSPTQTWISGPSATSDIELNRVEGVHGPRKLDVVIVVGRQSFPSGSSCSPEPKL
jgi:iron-sulfur cluster protein